MKKLLILLFFISALISCAKKVDVHKYTVVELTSLAHESSQAFGKGNVINFSDYNTGVNHKDSMALKYKQLSFFAIAFENEEQARSEALRLNQYYARNWLFDRVEGEPVLEDYVIETFKAQNPNRHTQRVPKKSAEGEKSHGEAEQAQPHH